MIGDWNKKEKPFLGLLGSGGGLGYLAGRVSEVADLLYEITNSGTSFNLRIGQSSANAFTVNWGDGSPDESFTNSEGSHTYSAAGNYKIKINNDHASGRMKTFFNGNSDRSEITLISVGSTTILNSSNTSLNKSFSGATNLTSIEIPFSATTGITNFNETWKNCSSLTSFPLIDTSSGTNFGSTWNNCSSLTSFPLINTSSATTLQSTWIACTGLTAFPLIDTSSVTNFSTTWRSCTGIGGSFPQIDTSSGTNFTQTWVSCSGITTFPLIDTSSGTNFGSTWEGCSGIGGSFPLIDTSNGTSFQNTWRNCSGITTFPLINTSSGTNFSRTWNGCSGIGGSFPQIDTSSGTNFGFTWSSCSGITTFPALDFSNATTVGQAWGNCSNLVEFPSVDFSSVTASFRRTWYFNTSLTTYPANQFDNISSTPSNGFQDAWRSCALTAQSIENILTSLDTNGQQNIQLGILGGFNANASTWSTDAIIAYRNLDNKGWTISQNGTPSMSDLEYTISNSGTSFTLRSTGTVNYTVDWGDGSDEETSTSNTLAHTYSSSGTYVVKINSNSGATYRPKFDSSGDEDQITSIAIGSEDSAEFSTDIQKAFKGAQNMTKYNQVGAASSSVTNFQATWRDCSGLTGTFPLIDTSSAGNLVATWQGCSGITTFPLIDTSSAGTVSASWSQCSGLTSFPLIDTSNTSNISFAWDGCSGLTSFPTIDTSSATVLGSSWKGCTGITTFPSLDFSSCTDFRSTWMNCISLTTYPANRFDSTGTLISNAFNNSWASCALTAQSIENILTSLDTNGSQNITLVISGGTNAAKSTWSTAANTAYTNLVNKGWTITHNS